MKYGRSLMELAAEIERQADNKADFVASTLNMQMTDSLDLQLKGDGGEVKKQFPISDIAHDQFSASLGIPRPYYERMRTSQPDLLATNVNRWMKEEPSRRMVRTLDGSARAVLSDRYRIIDNDLIAAAVFPVLSDLKGISVESCEITPSRMYIKVVNPRLQGEVTVGDVVQAGMMITNSEVGYGAVKVQPLMYRLVCKNGMIANVATTKRRHVGRGNEAGEDFTIYESETLQADAKAFLLKVRDTVKAVAEEVHFNRILDQMKAAHGIKIDSQNIPGLVELTSKEYYISKDESVGVTNHLIRGGDFSLYGLANAITRQAQDVQSYDRSTELEGVGYDVMTMGAGAFKRLNTLSRDYKVA